MSADRTDALLAQLSAGISELADSGRWTEYLAVQSRFHRYSFRNALLVSLQCPSATQVAGYRAWQGLGRQVRKGEQAIYILAPVTRKSDDETRIVVGFHGAAVFDVAQTDGDELPAVHSLLEGSDPAGLWAGLVGFASSIGFRVADATASEFGDARNGDCSHSEHLIRVSSERSAAQRAKTLAHELGHAILHGPENRAERGLIELEAESVAYTVCGSLGLDTGAYSFGYLANWSGGTDEATAALKTSGAAIAKAAHTILAHLEGSTTETGEVAA